MIITLTTDFGLADPFVGIMKGVILSIAPAARIVDITHNIESHDIDSAALVIESAVPYFPAATVHVVVVDPGVGSVRRPIAARVGDHFFVGPDNGVLSLALHSQSPAPPPVVCHITNEGLCRNPLSRTFHGRDIFAPVAAHLALGAPLESAGPRITDFIERPPRRPVSLSNGRLTAIVLRVDKFGNMITNLRRADLGIGFVIRIAGIEVRRLVSNYDAGMPGEVFAIEGSAGYIELSRKQGSAAEIGGITAGVEMEVETGEANQ